MDAITGRISMDDLRTIGMRRECGGCTACCSVIEVSELGKGFRTPCPHQSGGCALWSGPGGPGGQPEVCSKYRCAWAMGFGQLDDRPDMSGILVDFRVDLRDLSKPPAFYAIGVRAGDEEKKEALRAMAGMAFETGWSILLTDENLDVILEVSP